jgi:predicted amidophosphoribosyltransferase
MISLGAMIAGAIMLARRQSDQVTVSDGSRYQSDELKTCPDCAEQIKRDAKMCRFCGKRDLPEEPDTPFEPAYYEHRPKEKTLFEKLFWSSTDPKHPGNRK